MADESSVKLCSFPSHFVAPQVKQGMEWCLAYTKAFESEAAHQPTENALFRANQHYDRLRKYGRGEQSDNQYKELMGLKKDQGKLNTSYRNLDFGILKVAPKLRNVLINKVVNQPYRLNIKPIDPTSIAERREYRGALTEMVISQEHIKRSKFLSQLGLQSPVPHGELPPTSLNEIDTYIDQHPKNTIALEVKDYVSFGMYYNDWEQIGREVTGDIVDLGVGGVRMYVDENGMVRIRKVWPERVIMNKCLSPDFRDMIRVGEYYEMTVSEFKKITGGSLGEETYKKLANNYSKGEQGRFSGNIRDYWQPASFSYTYDPEKITLLDATWKSTDAEVYLEKSNESGNRRMIKKEFNYVPYAGDKTVNDGKGYSDSEFNEKFQGEKQIYRKQITNIYQCTYVVGSENICVNYGLMKDMPRSVSKIAETSLPYIFVSTDFTSTIGTIEEVLDQIQMNWLQFQSHVAASKPDGVAIERKALSKLNALNAGKFDPKEALVMYSEIGSFIFDGYDAHGNPLPWLPFKEIKNGMSEAADQHFSKILQLLDMARGMLGINLLTEGQTPPERMGKAVAQMSFGATDNALSHLNESYSKLYERIARQMVLLMQGSIHRMDENSFNEALGFESWNVLNMNADIGLRELGITIEEGPDTDLRNKISIILQKGVDAKEINPEDAIAIEMEDNVYRQMNMLKKNRQERDNKAQQNQQALVQQQGQQQAQMEQAKIAAQTDADNKKMQADQQMFLLKTQTENQSKQDDFMRSVVLEKLKGQEKLTLEQERWMNKIFETRLILDSEEKQAEMAAEAKENQPVAAQS